MRPDTSVSLPDQRDRNTHIFDDPAPISLSRLCSVREVLRIILNVGLLLGEGCAWVMMYSKMDVVNQEYVLICFLLLSVPSPIFLHLFYLYEVTKCVGRSRPLGN